MVLLSRWTDNAPGGPLVGCGGVTTKGSSDPCGAGRHVKMRRRGEAEQAPATATTHRRSTIKILEALASGWLVCDGDLYQESGSVRRVRHIATAAGSHMLTRTFRSTTDVSGRPWMP